MTVIDLVQLSGRRLQNHGGVVHTKGLIPATLPRWLQQLCARVHMQLPLFGDEGPNHVLINSYQPGCGIMVSVIAQSAPMTWLIVWQMLAAVDMRGMSAAEQSSVSLVLLASCGQHVHIIHQPVGGASFLFASCLGSLTKMVRCTSQWSASCLLGHPLC